MRLLLVLLLIPMIASADAPKSKVPFVVQAEREPVIAKQQVDTALGKVNANLYVMFQSDSGSGMLNAIDYPLPARYAKSKPEAIYALLEKALKKTKNFEKSTAIKIGKDPARDVLHAAKSIDAKAGKSYTRERWVVRSGRVYEFRAVWSENGDGAKEWVKTVGDPFIESIAFP